MSILLELVNIIPFSILHLKNMSIYIALDISIKNIFKTDALKRYMWFLLCHYPINIYIYIYIPHLFLYPSKKLLPTIMISLHMEENQSQGSKVATNWSHMRLVFWLCT